MVDSVLWAEVVGFDPSAAVSEAGALLRRVRCLLSITPTKLPTHASHETRRGARHSTVNVASMRLASG